MKSSYVLLFMLMAISACSRGEEVASQVPDLILEDRILQAKTPGSVDEASGLLIQAMSLESRAAFAAVERRDLIEYHHNLGRLVRNEFKLWGAGNSNLIRSYKATHPISKYRPNNDHPDGISEEIIERAWEKVQILRK